MDSLGLYVVQVFDKDDTMVDQANVVEWSRRMAYFEVMGDLKDHMTFSSHRVRDATEEEVKEFLRAKGHDI